jgi:hypothetical protein
MAQAYSHAGQDAVAGYWTVLEALIPEAARVHVDALGR